MLWIILELYMAFHCCQTSGNSCCCQSQCENVHWGTLNILLPVSFAYRQFCKNFRYHLKDVIVGKIYFLLVRIKIKHMEIAIIKKETTGSG